MSPVFVPEPRHLLREVILWLLFLQKLHRGHGTRVSGSHAQFSDFREQFQGLPFLSLRPFTLIRGT